MADALQKTTDQAQKATNEGSQKWEAMSDEQKKTTFDQLPAEQKHGKTYYEWITEGYHKQYENWMPWIEDQYLKWFTKDNKASYATKDTLDKSKVTGVEPIDKAQDGVHGLAAGQLGRGGALQPLGDAVSKEGVNRAERGGKDPAGSYSGSGYVDSALSGAKGAGAYVGGMLGGKKEEAK